MLTFDKNYNLVHFDNNKDSDYVEFGEKWDNFTKGFKDSMKTLAVAAGIPLAIWGVGKDIREHDAARAAYNNRINQIVSDYDKFRNKEEDDHAKRWLSGHMGGSAVGGGDTQLNKWISNSIFENRHGSDRNEVLRALAERASEPNTTGWMREVANNLRREALFGDYYPDDSSDRERMQRAYRLADEAYEPVWQGLSKKPTSDPIDYYKLHPELLEK